ncbi:hypothetical protein HZS_3799 [Henneguya salminicola]|nr:hypothetical protein HZS_3799 [Henneguya salminicola]
MDKSNTHSGSTHCKGLDLDEFKSVENITEHLSESSDINFNITSKKIAEDPDVDLIDSCNVSPTANDAKNIKIIKEGDEFFCKYSENAHKVIGDPNDDDFVDVDSDDSIEITEINVQDETIIERIICLKEILSENVRSKACKLISTTRNTSGKALKATSNIMWYTSTLLVFTYLPLVLVTFFDANTFSP